MDPIDRNLRNSLYCLLDGLCVFHNAIADELERVFAVDVTDYNNIRPHISFNGYTPWEVQTGITGLDMIWKDQIKDAGKIRLIVNRKELCEIISVHLNIPDFHLNTI